MVIREEKISDYRASELMVRRAFFNRQNPGCCEHYLVHLLRNSFDYLPEFSRVAEIDGRIVGAIFYSKAIVQTENGEFPVATFGPLAVDPVFQGLGIGRKLFEESRALLSSSGYPAIIIYGEPNYYPKLGFRRAAEYGVTDPEGNVYDALMVFELRKKSLEGIRGKFFESSVFEKGSDRKAADAFDCDFPFCPKLRIPSQWLHETNLGRIEKIDGARYGVLFWEILIEAELSPSYSSRAPKIGDYVTFRWHRGGLSEIETLETPIEARLP
ncbi:MAG: N-acetyltransferase [Bacilli bacterium]